jgi:hypothetical protein
MAWLFIAKHFEPIVSPFSNSILTTWTKMKSQFHKKNLIFFKKMLWQSLFETLLITMNANDPFGMEDHKDILNFLSPVAYKFPTYEMTILRNGKI